MKPQQEQQQRGTANGDGHGLKSGDAHDEGKVNGGDAGENANVDGNDEEKVNGGGHSDHDDRSDHDDHSHDRRTGNGSGV